MSLTNLKPCHIWTSWCTNALCFAFLVMWADSISHLIFPRTQLYFSVYHGGCSWTKHGSCRCVPVSKSSVFQRACLSYSVQVLACRNIPRHGTALLELKSHHTKPNHHLYTEKAHKILCNECLKWPSHKESKCGFHLLSRNLFSHLETCNTIIPVN